MAMVRENSSHFYLVVSEIMLTFAGSNLKQVNHDYPQGFREQLQEDCKVHQD